METVTEPRITPSPTGRRIDAAAIRDALRTTEAAVSSDRLPGAVCGVADSVGILALETIPGPRTRNLREDSLFFLASVTKPIVATGLIRLVDRGLVDLHRPIDRWVPAFRGPGKERVTPWHVLTHTSGIPDQEADVLRRERPTAARMLDVVCSAPLRFEPGSRYEYCSSSFYLLAELMATAVGRPFPDALRELVLSPVGMSDTSFDPRHGRRRIVPVEGVPIGNVLVRELVLRFLARATLPGGGLWGTAQDLLRFGQMLLPAVTATGAGLLSPEAVEEMTREHTQGIVEVSADGVTRDPHYALGWGKARSDGGVPSVMSEVAGPPVTLPASPGTFTHGGATGTRLWIDPDHDLVFVFLSNLWGADDGAMFATLAEVYRALET